MVCLGDDVGLAEEIVVLRGQRRAYLGLGFWVHFPHFEGCCVGRGGSIGMQLYRVH